MASEAASTLSCWTLGFGPSYSMMVNPVDANSNNDVRERVEEPSVKTGVQMREDSTCTVDDLQLPVSLSLSNEEFERVLNEVDLMASEQPGLIQEVSKAGNLEVAVRTDVVSTVPFSRPVFSYGRPFI